MVKPDTTEARTLAMFTLNFDTMWGLIASQLAEDRTHTPEDRRKLAKNLAVLSAMIDRLAETMELTLDKSMNTGATSRGSRRAS